MYLDETRRKHLEYGTIVLLVVVSFFTAYTLAARANATRHDIRAGTDKLSGEPTQIYSYRESNPFGSYLAGFTTLDNVGITREDQRYIEDVLINFAMYNKKAYNARISYVKDSFQEEPNHSSAWRTYSFRFGINNGDLHTMKVRSNWIESKIEITILDGQDKQVFQRSFTVYG